MMGRVGAKQPFAQGRADLEELAGVVVKTKQVERVSAQLGVQFEALCQREREAILSGKVAPLLPAVPILYIAIDGTGVPVVPRETEGRRGKDATGKAKTREAKIGCVFTQTKQDEEGYPIRDEDSTSYVGAIESAEVFGSRIYAEAVRRGLRQAQKVVVLGDGGPWIWGIAAQYFPWAIEIVDLYHAREHLANLGKVVYGPTSAQAKQWAAARSEQLDDGDVEARDYIHEAVTPSPIQRPGGSPQGHRLLPNQQRTDALCQVSSAKVYLSVPGWSKLAARLSSGYD